MHRFETVILWRACSSDLMANANEPAKSVGRTAARVSSSKDLIWERSLPVWKTEKHSVAEELWPKWGMMFEEVKKKAGDRLSTDFIKPEQEDWSSFGKPLEGFNKDRKIIELLLLFFGKITITAYGQWINCRAAVLEAGRIARKLL